MVRSTGTLSSYHNDVYAQPVCSGNGCRNNLNPCGTEGDGSVGYLADTGDARCPYKMTNVTTCSFKQDTSGPCAWGFVGCERSNFL